MIVSKETYRALDQLTATADGQQLLKMLRADLDEAVEQLMIQTDSELHRQQGKAKYLDELLKRFDQSKNLKR